MTTIHPRDYRIPAAGGTLFARQWEPEETRHEGRAPIVLFHDSLGCVALWRDFPRALALATRRSVVAYDRLGFGESDACAGELPAGFIHEEASKVVPALLEALGHDDFIAFGHSVGGGMASVSAALMPARCRGVISESAQAFVEERTLAGIREARQAFARPEQMARLRKYHGDKSEWVLSAWVDTWLSEAFRQWNLNESLARVQCPVLAIHGDSDEYGSLQQPERIASLPPGPTTLAVLEGCGHVPHREQPDQVLEAVTAFLQGSQIAE